MDSSKICIFVAIVLYLIAMLLIGFWCSKRNSTVDDFYLGGRHLGPLVTAMSAEASDMSSWLLMGLPGVAYLSGTADAAWTGIGLALGTYINWLMVAKPLRRYTQEIGAITVPDFFSKRYGDNKKLLLGISAVVIIIFFVPYTASGFAACGKLFSTLYGINYMAAMLISAAVIVTYTTLGGFLAASTTDLVQSIVMTVALFIVLIFGNIKAGGIQAVLDNARALPGYLSMVQSYSPDTGAASPYRLITIISTMAWGLGYFGMPHILLRFMAIEDEKKLRTSRRIACVWVVISMSVAIIIGIVAYGMSKAGAIDVLTGSASETAIVKIAALLSQEGVLPALLAGVILAGILAATMSTSDSQLLAAASSVSQNLFHDVFKIKMSEKTAMVVARGTIIVISVISAFLAGNPNSSVFQIVSFAWAGFGAAFGPVMLFALFWRRSNQYGALAGMIAGGAMVFIWKFAVRPLGGLWNIYELLPAFLVACIAIVVVSLLTGEPDKSITTPFDKVMRGKKA